MGSMPNSTGARAVAIINMIDSIECLLFDRIVSWSVKRLSLRYRYLDLPPASRGPVPPP